MKNTKKLIDRYMEETLETLENRGTGEAVWKTPSQASIAESNDPSSNKHALKIWSLSLAPSSASKCSVFLGSSRGIHTNWTYNQ